MRRRTLVLSLPLVAAACAAPADGPAEPVNGPERAFYRYAAELAAAWRRAPGQKAWRDGFVPLQDLTVLPADPGFTDATRQAYLARWFRLTAALPRESGRRQGSIRFADGATLTVPLIGSAAAYAALQPQRPPACPERLAGAGDGTTVRASVPDGCATLQVTKVTLGTVQVRTSRGAATVPAWLFTVRELKGPIARVAVAPEATSAPPAPAPVPEYPEGLVGAQDLSRVAGAEVGARLKVGACDTDIQPLVYEADDVVVLGGRVTNTATVCTDNLLMHPVTVTLGAPLGTRPVLDAQTGQVLSLTAE